MFRNEVSSLRAAIAFLTLLPVCSKEQFSEKAFANSIQYFSFVGFIFAILNLVWIICFKNYFFDKPFLFALGFILLKVFLSGALHLDGLMDSFDGIAASKKTREETLTVMKDSRVGAFGAMAGTLILLAEFAFLTELDYKNNILLIAFLLYLLPIMSRFMMVLIINFQVKKSDVINDASSLAIFKKNPKTWMIVLLNLLTVKAFAWIFIMVFKLPFDKLIYCDFLIVPWMIITWLIYAWLKFKLKGHNGDSMGAGLEISEAVYLLLMALSS